MAYDHIFLKDDTQVYSKKYKRAYKGFSWTAVFFSYLAAFYRQDIKGGIFMLVIDSVVTILAIGLVPAIMTPIKSQMMAILFLIPFRILYGLFYNKIHLKMLKDNGYKIYKKREK